MPENRDERVLLFAPLGRDGELAARTLQAAGIEAVICTSISMLCSDIAAGAGGVLLTQEALTAPGSIPCLLDVLNRQPAWSDLPLIVLISGSSNQNPYMLGLPVDRVNATFLERPVRSPMLIRAVQIALRARRRQYELRGHLEALVEAQQAERQARTVAEEAVRIRDEFLGAVAHDLKNPLTAAKGYIQMMQRQLARGQGEPERLSQGLDRLAHSVTRTLALIDELLDVARLQAGQPLQLHYEQMDLVGLARQVADEHQQLTSQHCIQVRTDLPELKGLWDGRRLQRVLVNLVNNALKYSREGGAITIELDRGEQNGTPAAVIRVCDQGIGIPEADLPHIFERFYRASNVGEETPGTGLGLAGVWQIVRGHGGTISAESREGVGSAFTVSLPLRAESLPADSAAMV